MPIVNAKTVEQCCAMAALTRFTLLVQWENMSKVLLEVQLKTNQVNVRSMERISKWSVLNAIISRSVWCVIFLDHIKIMRLCWSRITLEMQKNHSPAFCQSWIKGCQPSRNLEKSSNRVLKRYCRYFSESQKKRCFPYIQNDTVDKRKGEIAWHRVWETSTNLDKAKRWTEEITRINFTIQR